MVHGSEDLIEVYSAVDDMSQSLINNWNRLVSPGDVVYVLGDVAMGKIADTLPMVSELDGDKVLVPGNHDRCWFGGKKNHADWIAKYEDVGFTILGNGIDYGAGSIDLSFLFSDVTDLPVHACHFPYYGDSHDADRYTAYRPPDVGGWLLHGHTHSNERVNGRMIHVGVDAWNYAPVSIDEIKELMK
jgi:calcineurin-like phosphoesterase family protein